jgi:hypothetical protein
MAFDVFTDFLHGLNPVDFAADRLAFSPDPWQAALLRNPGKQIILNVCRQGGKSTTTAALALHTALHDPGSLTLLVSPSQRQSKELFAKAMAFLKSLEPAEELDEDNRLSATLKNGSRIVSLPGDSKTIRGFSAPSLVVEDEASYVSDEVYAAIRPMLAVSRGRIILMSTPAGRRGHFHQVWDEGVGWERIKITGAECPRITKEFLEQEERELGPLLFQQEYMGVFNADQASVFDETLIEAMITDDFEMFAL